MATSTAVDQSALARVLGIETRFQDLRGGAIVYLPQRVMIVGQGTTAQTYSTSKRTFTRANEIGAVYGYGSPVHLAAKQLLPVNGDGVGTIPVTVYPLDDAVGSLASSGSITPVNAATVPGSYRVSVNGILSEAFTIAPAESVAAIATKMVTAINAVIDMPLIATDGTGVVDLDSKWAGSSANDIKVSMVGPSVGATFTVVQPTGGATNPDVNTALNQVGGIWETLVVNCLNISDTVSLDTYNAFGEGRWGALTRKPVIVFTGNNIASPTTATTVSAARTTDRVNAQIVAPGSASLPLQIAARAVARIARVANNNPAKDYPRQALSGIVPGSDVDQWDYTERDFAVKRGSGTTEIIGGVVNTDNTVMFYFPTNDPTPAYRKAVTIVKLQQIIFNLDLIFNSDTWAGAPLIPDGQATTNTAAKQPKDAKAAVAAMLDKLGTEAIISDPEAAKRTIQANISSTNPDRLDIAFIVQISGNTDVISIDLNFGFYFGQQTLIA